MGPYGHGKIGKVLGEFKRGSLKSGSGQSVTSRKQAIAIALSEARRAGARIPKPKHKGGELMGAMKRRMVKSA